MIEGKRQSKVRGGVKERERMEGGREGGEEMKEVNIYFSFD